MTKSTIVACFACIAMCRAALHAQPCELSGVAIQPGADRLFSPYPYALLEFDVDGPGPLAPALVCAGGNPEAEPRRWNGQAWQSFGIFPGWTEFVGGTTRSMIAFDLDAAGPLPTMLLLGGSIDMRINGTLYNNLGILGWNGSHWFVPPQPGGLIRSMVAYDPDGDGPTPRRLFAYGSSFDLPSGSARAVIQLVGQQWQATNIPEEWEIGSPSNAGMLWLHDFDGAGPLREELLLCTGLHATLQGGGTIGGVARRTGTTWSMDGVGIPGFRPTNYLHTITTHDFDGSGPLPPSVVVAGRIRMTGVAGAHMVARLDAGVWTPLADPDPPPQSVYGVFAVASQDFDDAGMQPPSLLAVALDMPVSKYEDGVWTPQAPDVGLGFGPTLIAGRWQNQPAIFVGGPNLERSNVGALVGCLEPCRADLDNSGLVDLVDLCLVLTNFGTLNEETDIDDDQRTALSDLAILLAEYGRACLIDGQ